MTKEDIRRDMLQTLVGLQRAAKNFVKENNSVALGELVFYSMSFVFFRLQEYNLEAPHLNTAEVSARLIEDCMQLKEAISIVGSEPATRN